MNNKYITFNDCDLIALTYNGEVVDYTNKDDEIENWLKKGIEYSWFCVVLED